MEYISLVWKYVADMFDTFSRILIPDHHLWYSFFFKRSAIWLIWLQGNMAWGLWAKQSNVLAVNRITHRKPKVNNGNCDILIIRHVLRSYLCNWKLYHKIMTGIHQNKWVSLILFTVSEPQCVSIVQPCVTPKQSNQHPCLSLLCSHVWPQNKAINTHVSLYCAAMCDPKTKQSTPMLVSIVQPCVTPKQSNQHPCLSLLCSHVWPQNKAINTHVCLYCPAMCDPKTKQSTPMLVSIVQPCVTPKQSNQHPCLSLLCSHVWPQNKAINTHVCLYCAAMCDPKTKQSTPMLVSIVQPCVTPKQSNQHPCLSLLCSHVWPQNKAINTHVCLYCAAMCDPKTKQSTSMLVSFVQPCVTPKQSNQHPC